MKYLLSILSLRLLFSCGNETTTTDKNTSLETVIIEDKISSKLPITFDWSLTAEEWIHTIWMDQYSEHPEEILG
ncbi:MAG: hypothetical protein ACI8P3_004107 [Saprospiraceae bacterium]|jgi:hypothetical protein